MLEVRNLHVTHGEVAAVRGLSLSVEAGQIVALTGANGAGKSSTLNAVAGVVQPAEGSIRFNGKEMAGRATRAFIREGIVQVPEGRMIFGTLSVLENLRIGAYRRGGFVLTDEGLSDVLGQFPMLEEQLRKPASSLSGGQAQMLALARGLMAKPLLLLLDEPTLGLSPIAAEQVFDLVRTLCDDGLTILIVEQNVRQTLALADRAYLVEGGRVVLEGSAQEIAGDKRLTSAYLGLPGSTGTSPPGRTVAGRNGPAKKKQTTRKRGNK